MYTIWAVFGGFILHFLLSNYLTVLLRPNFEEPVDTAADLIDRNITPVVRPHREILVQTFANSPDPIYRELSRRILVAKTINKYNVYRRAIRKREAQGDCDRDYAVIFPRPKDEDEEAHYSSEVVKGFYHFPGSIANKKWPLKKVFKSSSMKQHAT